MVRVGGWKPCEAELPRLKHPSQAQPRVESRAPCACSSRAPPPALPSPSPPGMGLSSQRAVIWSHWVLGCFCAAKTKWVSRPLASLSECCPHIRFHKSGLSSWPFHLVKISHLLTSLGPDPPKLFNVRCIFVQTSFETWPTFSLLFLIFHVPYILVKLMSWFCCDRKTAWGQFISCVCVCNCKL